MTTGRINQIAFVSKGTKRGGHKQERRPARERDAAQDKKPQNCRPRPGSERLGQADPRDSAPKTKAKRHPGQRPAQRYPDHRGDGSAPLTYRYRFRDRRDESRADQAERAEKRGSTPADHHDDQNPRRARPKRQTTRDRPRRRQGKRARSRPGTPLALLLPRQPRD